MGIENCHSGGSDEEARKRLGDDCEVFKITREAAAGPGPAAAYYAACDFAGEERLLSAQPRSTGDDY